MCGFYWFLPSITGTIKSWNSVRKLSNTDTAHFASDSIRTTAIHWMVEDTQNLGVLSTQIST